MRADALHETFALLDELDPVGDVPVIAVARGYRFGKQSFNLSAQTLSQIQRRNGVVGLIVAQHELNDGIRRRKTWSSGRAVRVIRHTSTEIAELAAEIGASPSASRTSTASSDPPWAECESIATWRGSAQRWRRRYSEEDLQRMMFGNGLR